MTSIIVAVLGGASAMSLLAFDMFRQCQHLAREVDEANETILALTNENVEQDEGIGLLLSANAALAGDVARLTRLAEIGLRRVKAVEKYEAKHRKGNGDA